MDAVDVLLLCVVGFSVLLFLIVDRADRSSAGNDLKEAEKRVNADEGEEQSFDDWEGIERTELEKAFGQAVVFVGGERVGGEIDGASKMDLYALQKVALDGSCHGSQPTLFNVAARAKWNAWQKLGNMSREMAMEKYLNILEEAIPGWKGYRIGAIKRRE